MHRKIRNVYEIRQLFAISGKQLRRYENHSQVGLYTSRGHGCGIYSELIFVESKTLKQAHSRLRNCFSNAAIGKKSADRNPQLWPREVYDAS